MQTTDNDWAALVLTPAFLARIDMLASKRFGLQGLAEEASAFVVAGLSDQDWAICKQYAGRAHAYTFLLALVNNLLEGFARQRFGRPRPPEWLKREGELWVEIWIRICLERQLAPTVIDAYSEPLRPPEFVATIIRTIKAKLPWCGSSEREIPADCIECSSQQQDPIGSTIVQQLSEQQLEEALEQLHLVFFSEARPSNSSEPAANWQQLRQQLELSAEELLLLRLVHQQGIKLTKVAEMLGMPHYQPGRLLKALYQRIGEALRLCHIKFDLDALNAEVSE